MKQQEQKQKPKAGFFGVAGCAGCLLTVIYEDVFVELDKMLDIQSFPLIKENNYKGDFDIVFIEGTATFDEDIVVLNELRKRAKTVVALGACACVGGVPSIKNFRDGKKIMGFVYPKFNHLKSEPPTPINKHIKVDYYLPQCPPDKGEIIEFVKCFISGRVFKNNKDPVCIECRKKGNLCLLEEGELCLGPVTKGGCGALCPSNGVTCYGCRGPFSDANYKAFIELLKKKGYTEEEIQDKMEIFAGLDFEEETEKISHWLEK
jgi:sulfhydrogenase subunit delta